MGSDSGRNENRARRIWFALIALVGLLIGAAIWKSARMAGTMSAAASGEQQFLQSTTGTRTKLVVEIAESGADGTIKGKLLQRKTEQVYTRSTSPVMVHSDPQTKVVMGAPSDIHPGAVIHVTGPVRDDHSITAEQIVILTGYVQVQ
jgi:hypothetical protein